MTGRDFFWIFVAALAIRVLNSALIATVGGSFFIEDSPLYYAIVDDWVRFGAYVRDVGNGVLTREIERLPAYPAFLLGLETVFGRSNFAVAIAQGTLDALTCAILASSISGISRRLGLVVGGLAVLNPNLIIVSSMVTNDTVFLFLIVSSFWSIMRYGKSAAWGYLVLAGALFGLATITRPVFYYLIPLIGIGGVCLVLAKEWPASMRSGLVSLGFLITLLAPIWGVLQANHEAYGRYFMSIQGGVHLMGWVLPMTHPDTRELSFEEGAVVWAERHSEEMARHGIDESQLSGVEAVLARQSYALAQLMKVPLPDLVIAWVKGSVKNVVTPAVLLDSRMRDYQPDLSHVNRDTGIVQLFGQIFSIANPVWLAIGALAFGVSLVLTGLSIWGGWTLLIRYPVPTCLAVMYMGYILAVLGPVSNPKYRLPIEPVLMVFAACALVRLSDFLTSLHRKPSGQRI